MLQFQFFIVRITQILRDRLLSLPAMNPRTCVPLTSGFVPIVPQNGTPNGRYIASVLSTPIMKLNDFTFQNRHGLIAKRGDLTESLENRAFAPNVNFYPRGGADDLETRELEDSWLIARGLGFLPNHGWLDYNSTLLEYRTKRYRKSSTY